MNGKTPNSSGKVKKSVLEENPLKVYRRRCLRIHQPEFVRCGSNLSEFAASMPPGIAPFPLRLVAVQPAITFSLQGANFDRMQPIEVESTKFFVDGASLSGTF